MRFVRPARPPRAGYVDGDQHELQRHRPERFQRRRSMAARDLDCGKKNPEQLIERTEPEQRTPALRIAQNEGIDTGSHQQLAAGNRRDGGIAHRDVEQRLEQRLSDEAKNANGRIDAEADDQAYAQYDAPHSQTTAGDGRG